MADILDRLKAALADRHTIERELGSGGMATVYLAHDIRHEPASNVTDDVRSRLTTALADCYQIDRQIGSGGVAPRATFSSVAWHLLESGRSSFPRSCCPG